MFIDIGNSFIKVASHSDGNWEILLRSRHDRIQDVMKLIETSRKPNQIIVASSVVSDLKSSLIQRFGKDIRFIGVSDFPKKLINYDTPETLGVDRVLACFGAHSIAGNKAVVVVDAGTATTIDFMNGEGCFEGGVIAPGLTLFENGLKSFAPALPRVDRSLPPGFPPKNTVKALQWGITGSYLHMVKAHVDTFLEQDSQAQIWITGGDADVLAQIRTLKLQYHPNLVFEGLKAWKERFLKL